MGSAPKRVQRALSALLLCLVCSFSCSAVHAQENSAGAPRADSKTANNAEFLAAADEVLQKMSEITGLKLLAPLKKSLRSREEIRAYVIKQMNEEKNPAERYADARTAEAFGLLPKGFDLDTFMVNVLTEQIEGLYLAALETGVRRRSRTSSQARSSANAASSASRKSQGAR